MSRLLAAARTLPHASPPLDLRKNLLASVVVFLVALPLCMGIAIASGVPPAAGLITGIIGGIVVGTLGGAPVLVSGPAAGLAVVVYELVQAHGLTYVYVVVVMAGAIQLLAGVLRLGCWFRAVSPAVIEGMLAGIGLLILASQFHVMVDDQPRGSGMANILSIPEAIWKGVVPLDGSLHHWAARIGLATIIMIVVWKGFAPKKLKMFPAPLVGVLFATALTAVLGLGINRVALGGFFDSLQPLSWGDIQGALGLPLLGSALGVAAIASAETLLCAVAVEKLRRDPSSRTNYDRELSAQGIGNMLSGMAGGLPMTGVIVRSAANVDAGGTNRLSAFFHGVWILLCVAAFPGLLELVPTAALAAVLVYTGWKLINVKFVRALWAADRLEVFVYIGTVAGIVLVDLLSGVLIGIGLEALRLLYTFTSLEISIREMEPNQFHIAARGSATFLRLPRLAAVIETVPTPSYVRLHFDALEYVDRACAELLLDWRHRHESAGGIVEADWSYIERHVHGRKRTSEHAQPARPQRDEVDDKGGGELPYKTNGDRASAVGANGG